MRRPAHEMLPGDSFDALFKTGPKKTMSLQAFIRKHRKEIDEYTGSRYKNDEERRLWVLNNEGLYLWARSEGVKI